MKENETDSNVYFGGVRDGYSKCSVPSHDAAGEKFIPIGGN